MNRNKDNKNRETGGDEFSVSIIRPDLVKEVEPEPVKDVKGSSPNKSTTGASTIISK